MTGGVWLDWRFGGRGGVMTGGLDYRGCGWTGGVWGGRFGVTWDGG